MGTPFYHPVWTQTIPTNGKSASEGRKPNLAQSTRGYPLFKPPELNTLRQGRINHMVGERNVPTGPKIAQQLGSTADS
ncbi:hypothetical protein NLI96_g6083 [Meripilus lineatus]|uniref:Uncharacterized protein n=1 Tax=Meripilus lineatus TaxID=2056292 RepID=A0AAD5V1P8_9APHY|nr:hypothetical protein NLI96_g6083 [Physisporinus lineatus]